MAISLILFLPLPPPSPPLQPVPHGANTHKDEEAAHRIKKHTVVVGGQDCCANLKSCESYASRVMYDFKPLVFNLWFSTFGFDF